MSVYDDPVLKQFFLEPDFHHAEHSGFPIFMQRNYSKAWCGYVGIPASHPHFGKNYSDRVPADRDKLLVGQQSPISLLLEAHKEDDGTVALDILYDCPGGITYAQDHKPAHEPDGLWWFGFDCSHYNDLSPKDRIDELLNGGFWRPGEYRTFEWVLAQVRKFAEQIAEHGNA